MTTLHESADRETSPDTRSDFRNTRSSEYILETRSLSRDFGKFRAVDGVSISVKPGEVFGLLGPNGAGKSTTIKMLTTLFPPTAGTAAIAGFDIVRQASSVRRSIGYVPQSLSADGSLTGYENLLIFAKLYDIPGKYRERRIQDILEFMDLQDAAQRLVRQYSGGMIRRLEVGQSLLHQPLVLFLDEPTVGLDPIARANVWSLIEQLREKFGIAIILTTHFLDEADVLCDRVAIMQAGKVVVTGPPSELKAALAIEDATLDDVFIHHTGNQLATGVSYRETSRSRRTSRRLG